MGQQLDSTCTQPDHVEVVHGARHHGAAAQAVRRVRHHMRWLVHRHHAVVLVHHRDVAAQAGSVKANCETGFC
jgi:hypothetical protein